MSNCYLQHKIPQKQLIEIIDMLVKLQSKHWGCNLNITKSESQKKKKQQSSHLDIHLKKHTITHICRSIRIVSVNGITSYSIVNLKQPEEKFHRLLIHFLLISQSYILSLPACYQGWTLYDPISIISPYVTKSTLSRISKDITSSNCVLFLSPISKSLFLLDHSHYHSNILQFLSLKKREKTTTKKLSIICILLNYHLIFSIILLQRVVRICPYSLKSILL